MNKSELFTQAHALAKTFTGDYSARFALAITELTGKVKAGYEYVAGKVKKQVEKITKDSTVYRVWKKFITALEESAKDKTNQDILFRSSNWNIDIFKRESKYKMVRTNVDSSIQVSYFTNDDLKKNVSWLF